MTKYIFVSGGVISGVGKGTITSSLARLLENQGLKVSPIKIDMYLNVDAGTIRPQEHGEVFVLDDGLECDQDLGNYERFLNRSLSRVNYMTSGSVYYSVITKEREFYYQGEDVETIPHVTDEIINRIKLASKTQKSDVVIIELGGTVGEYQNAVFFEANRLMKMKNPNDVIHLHVAYLIAPPSIGELKTKPIQQSVKTLNSMGIQPDFVVTRSETEIDEPRRKKISLFCNVPEEAVISSPDLDNIYEVPEKLKSQKLDQQILDKFNLKPRKSDEKTKSKWKKLVKNIQIAKKRKPVKIGVIGKYFRVGSFSLSDVYISVLESLKYAGWNWGKNIEIVWIDGEDIEKGNTKKLSEVKGIIVPGGFGSRGIEGILKAIKYARQNNIPYLGLCYGLQLALIEYSRNVCKLKNANTTEIDPKTPHPIVDILPTQKDILQQKKYGGTMRLGSYLAELEPKSNTFKAYKKFDQLKNDKQDISQLIKDKQTDRIGKYSSLENCIIERHRHRYEVNPDYIDILKKEGIVFSGFHTRLDNQKLVEFIELPDHPFFVATQAHPEFKSRPLSPSPLFLGFIEASIKK